MFKDRSLLITGGTGSFGNAVLRRLSQTEISEIRILSRDEKKQDDMRRLYHDSRIRYYIGDVRQIDSLEDAMAGVDFIFHAAALKQVPSCEFHPMEAVRTNIIGTDNVLRAAIAARAKKMVVLSTDKAAYPINTMGMSKALMEKTAIAKSRFAAKHDLTVTVTRYGNVLCSRGSVVPRFFKQARSGLPVTVTDPEMTRFMMTLDEAVDLVLHAFENGLPGELLVQKAPAARIGDLARAIVRLAGGTSAIRVIGTRHGEKLYETLLTREERARAKESERYFSVSSDDRDLNYELATDHGDVRTSKSADFHSHNTRLLTVDEIMGMLRGMGDQMGEEI